MTQLEHGTATAGTNYIAGYPDNPAEHVPEWTWPNMLLIVDRMRTDSACHRALNGVANPIIGARWHLDPADARPDVVDFVARNIDLPILGSASKASKGRTRNRFLWDAHTREAFITALAYGHSVWETVFVIRDGKAHLRKVAPRVPHSLAEIVVDTYGDLESVKQWVPSGTVVKIDADRLLFYTVGKEGAAYQGQSVFRACYKNWLIKDRLLRIDANSAERHGVGVATIEAPPNATPADMHNYAIAAAEYSAMGKTGGALPHGATLKIAGVSGSIHDTIGSVRYHDEQIAKSVGRAFGELGTSSTGSRAVGETLMDDFLMGLNAVAYDFATAFNQQIVERLVDLNFGPDEQVPVVSFAPIGTDTALPVDHLVKLVQAGVLTADDDLESYVRDRYDLPDREAIQQATGLPVARPIPVPANRAEVSASGKGPARWSGLPTNHRR